MSAPPTRLAEILGALSLSTDLAAGLANESALKICLVATATAREMGVSGEPLRTIYYTSLMRFLGCTAYSYEMARDLGGDDMGALRALSAADAGNPASVFKAAARGLAAGSPPLARVRAFLKFLSDPKAPGKVASSHCAQAVFLAGQLQLDPATIDALDQIYERFDGKGHPHGLRGEQILLPARLVHLGFRVVAHQALLGPGEALEAVRSRSGSELDPEACAAFGRIAPGLMETLAKPSAWEAFLATEPAPYKVVADSELPRLCTAFAMFADLKSPYTLGHSLAVSALAEHAAGLCGLPEPERMKVQVSALLHDVGRVSVANGIWDAPRALTPLEWDRARQHAHETERILRQSRVLEPFAEIAGLHHERLDGSGYHRGLAGEGALPLPAAILAAADTYRTKTEERAHRRALAPEAAACHLAGLARAGKLDRRAVEAVISAAGERVPRVAGELPAGLSEREREILVLVAMGLTNKQIAARLTLSARTVQNHLASVFAKSGASNRAAAALFAVRHGLVE